MFISVLLFLKLYITHYNIFDTINNNEALKCITLFDEHLIISIADTKGIIQDVSDAFCKISGYTKEELIGKPHNIVRHPDSSSETFKELWATIKSGSQWKGEIKNRKKDGSYYWVIATIFPRLDIDKNIIGFISIRQDITAAKEIIQHEKRLKEQAKNAAMGEMIGMIAHQWRQPLSSINAQGSSLLIKMELNKISNEDIKSTILSIQKNTSFLSDTIDTFRDFFKDGLKSSKYPIEELLEYATKLIEPLLNENYIELVINIPTSCKEEKWMTNAVSKNDFAHIILNLIKNSIDEFISKTVSSPIIEINLNKEDDIYIIEFLDNAGGIPEESIPHVFEKDFSTKGEDGAGLGLYMTKKIIEEHLEGNITVHNKKDGACFTVKIPVSPA